MKDLLEALSIFGKYADLERPTHCEPDTLYIIGVTRSIVSDVDNERLLDLGFYWDTEEEVYISFKFGNGE